MLSCFDIADYFIGLANETGSFISNLKLQKLVYYAQAWHLALHDAPLFEEDFQAWIHGPVIPVLFEQYQSFSWRPIQKEVTVDLPDTVEAFLEEVVDEYFGCDAYDLMRMVRAEMPWKKARNGISHDEPSENTISKEWMKEYYLARAQEQEEKELESQKL